MTTEQIKEAILGLIDEYHISKVILFGSRAMVRTVKIAMWI